MLKVKDWVGFLSAPILLATVGCAAGQNPFAATRQGMPPERMMAMGQAFERQGHYDQAKFAYQYVLAVQPTFPNAQQNLDTLLAKEARVREQQGDTSNAVPNQVAGNSQQPSGNAVPSGATVPQSTQPEPVNPANFIPQSPLSLSTIQIPKDQTGPQSNLVKPEVPDQPAPQPIRITPAASPDQIPTTGQPPAQSVKITPYSPAAPLLESLLSVPVRGELTTPSVPAKIEPSITLREPLLSPETRFVTTLEAETVAMPLTISPAVVSPSPTVSDPSPEVTVVSNVQDSSTHEFLEVAVTGRAMVTSASLDFDEIENSSNLDESTPTELNSDSDSDSESEIDLNQIDIVELKPYFSELHAGMVEKLKQRREQFENPLVALAVDAKMPTVIRSRAILLLGSMGADAIAVVPVLRRVMHRDGDGYLRVELSEAILKIQPHDEDAVKVLVDCLKESDQDLRWVASLAIRNTTSQQTGFVVDRLKELLLTDDERLKRMIFLTLAEFGTASASAIPEIEAALECSDQRTREVAMAALTCVAPDRKGVAKVRLMSHQFE